MSCRRPGNILKRDDSIYSSKLNYVRYANVRDPQKIRKSGNKTQIKQRKASIKQEMIVKNIEAKEIQQISKCQVLIKPKPEILQMIQESKEQVQSRKNSFQETTKQLSNKLDGLFADFALKQETKIKKQEEELQQNKKQQKLQMQQIIEQDLNSNNYPIKQNQQKSNASDVNDLGDLSCQTNQTSELNISGSLTGVSSSKRQKKIKVNFASRKTQKIDNTKKLLQRFAKKTNRN